MVMMECPTSSECIRAEQASLGARHARSRKAGHAVLLTVALSCEFPPVERALPTKRFTLWSTQVPHRASLYVEDDGLKQALESRRRAEDKHRRECNLWSSLQKFIENIEIHLPELYTKKIGAPDGKGRRTVRRSQALKITDKECV